MEPQLPRYLRVVSLTLLSSSARQGFGCDNVVAFEVVLADGRIVNATKDTYSDLFVVLKGGSNNFGIVTRFTIKVGY